MERKTRSRKGKTTSFDYANFEKVAIEKLKAGKGLIGPEGALTGMIQRILQAALEGEMDEHMSKEENPNRRNGYTSKQVQTSMGNINVDPLRDRNGS